MIAQPAADEYADFHQGYMAAVAGEPDAIAVLERQQRAIESLRGLSPEEAAHRYAPEKWSIREIIGHLADTERVLSYRLLCVARGEPGVLPGFDQETYVANSNADRRDLQDLLDELAVVRQSTLSLARSLEPAALTRRGTVYNWTLSARAMTFIIAGHFQHHLNVLRDRYGVTAGS